MRKNSNLGGIAAAIIIATATVGCTDGIIYDQYKPLNGWERADTAKFSVPAAAEAGIYRTDIGLRTNADYPFTGICLIVDKLILPAGTTQSDTLNCQLIDKHGRATGRGLSNYQYLFNTSSTCLKKGDSLVVTVRHNMKRETLPGIEDVGLKITKE